MAWDDTGAYLANTCYFIPTREKWLLGVLLSSAMLFYVRKAIGSDEGGFIRLFAMHVKKFPIPNASAAQKACIERLVEYLLWLRRSGMANGALPGRADGTLVVGYFEKWVNALVYELFFPEPLHAAGLYFFDLADAAKLEPVNGMEKSTRFSKLHTKFEELYRPENTLRRSLFALDSIDEVRIIEGKT